MIDVGTRALPRSISNLYFYMHKYPNVGGCCGEIEVEFDQSVNIFSFSYALVASQYVEYKISHYLDKACESLVGFVSVLPGAFSMLRFEAI